MPRVAKLPSQLIEEVGWCQNTSCKQGRTCMMGAVDRTLDPPWDVIAWDWMIDKLAPQSPTRWNDRAGRTKNDVLKVLREMEAALELEVG